MSYSHDTLETLGQGYIVAVQSAIDATPEDDSRLTQVEGTPFLVGRKSYAISLWWEGRHITNANSAADIARNIAIRLLNKGMCA